MRIAIAGTGKLGTRLLHPIMKSHHKVVAIVQNGRTTKGLRRWTDPVLAQFTGDHISVVGVGKRHGIPAIYIDKMTPKELAPLERLEPDLLLVAGFAIILKRPLLTLPKVGCLNLHTSLLPMHRGPNPFSAVILANESETGVTFHGMDEGIDTGPIVAQYHLDIGPEDTAGTIYNRASDMAGEKILEVLEKVERDGISGTPQDPNGGCYDKKLTVEEMFVRWTDTAEEIDRLFRACYPFSLARTRYGDRVIYLSKLEFDPTPVVAEPGTVLDASNGVTVATGKGTVRILVGLVKSVIFSWPTPFNRPVVGEKMG